MIPPKILTRLAAGRPPVGKTPHDEVFRENKWRLLRYRAPAGGRRFRRPVLLVPSLINRYYVLDLLPGRSLAEYLVGMGHDLFVIDWGTPGDEDRYLSFDTYCDRYLGRAVRKTARISGSQDVHLLGYCLGGTLAAIHAALAPERIASFTALAAPIRFDDGGMLSQWTRTKSFDVRAIVAACGNVPWPLMQASFQLLKPTMNLAKTVQLWDRAWDDEFLDGFFAVETWSNDNVSFPGECYRQYIEELYQNDALVKGDLYISGQRVDLGRLTCPIHAITFRHDHIVPAASASALLEHANSRDAVHVELSGGHVGAVVSKKAALGLWPALSSFWAERDAPAVASAAS